MVAPPPPSDEHYFFTRFIGNTTKHLCPTFACRETNTYIKGWALTGSTLRSHVQTHHMDMVDLMSNYLLFSSLKACIDYTKLYTPGNGDAEHCREHRRIFKTLQQSNTNLTRMLEEHRYDIGPIVDTGCVGNNSLDGAQGLVHNLNLPSMEQILTTSLPTSD
jgi:uncharacterized protein involved in tolerance to divalent cations